MSCQFSNNGKYLFFSEAADFVHIYDTSNYDQNQVLDFFGEVMGFQSIGDWLYIGIWDNQYSSIMMFNKNKNFDSEYNQEFFPKD